MKLYTEIMKQNQYEIVHIREDIEPSSSSSPSSLLLLFMSGLLGKVIILV